MSYHCDHCTKLIVQRANEKDDPLVVCSACNGDDGTEIVIDDNDLGRTWVIKVHSFDHEIAEHFHERCILAVLAETITKNLAAEKASEQ